MRDDVCRWYGSFARLACDIAVSDCAIALRARTLLAEKFSGLWVNAGIFDDLEQIAAAVHEKEAWNKGWVAIRSTIRYHKERMPADVLERLNRLEQALSPASLIERARTYAFSAGRGWIDLADTEEEGDDAAHSYYRVEEKTQEIGREVARNREVFLQLLPELFDSSGSRLTSFGRGLAEGCEDKQLMWDDLCHHLAIHGHERTNYQVMVGFLSQWSQLDKDGSESMLDTAITDSTLGPVFPLLQSCVEIGDQGAERLMQSLQHGTAPIHWYQHIGYGRTHKSINDEKLSALLKSIAAKENGLFVALDILQMRLHKDPGDEPEIGTVLKSAGQELILELTFDREQHHMGQGQMDYEAATIFKKCFSDENAYDNAEILCKNLANSMSGYRTFIMDYDGLLDAIATIQPLAFLNGFLSDITEDEHRAHYLFDYYRDDGATPILKINEDLIIEWCEIEPLKRYPVLSVCIPAFVKGSQDGDIEWSSLAKRIMTDAPDPVQVLDNLKHSFRPMEWTGSRANIMESRLPLITTLQGHENPTIAEWARNEEIRFKLEISLEREDENRYRPNPDESFE
jgi:hypothetical protein